MPRFYLRAAVGDQPRGHVRAVCYKRIGKDETGTSFTVLLSDEWGEKEILRKMKDMGLFELGQAFIPVGPDLEKDLSLLASRAISFGILRLDEESASAFIKRKLSGSEVHEGDGGGIAENDSVRDEKNERLVRRLCDEGESFLRRLELSGQLGKMKRNGQAPPPPRDNVPKP